MGNRSIRNPCRAIPKLWQEDRSDRCTRFHPHKVKTGCSIVVVCAIAPAPKSACRLLGLEIATSGSVSGHLIEHGFGGTPARDAQIDFC